MVSIKMILHTRRETLFWELIASFIHFISAKVRFGRTFINCESWLNGIIPESVESLRSY